MVLSILLVLGEDEIVVVLMLRWERSVEGLLGWAKAAQALLGKQLGATTPRAVMGICAESRDEEVSI